MTTGNDKTHQGTKKRRGRGEDTIYFDKSKGLYVAAVSRGYAPTGQRRRHKVYGRTKADVRDKLRELRKELDIGVKASARYTVADAVNDWLSRGLIGRGVETVKKNRGLAEKHVVPAIGKVKLRELTADDVDDWLATKTGVLATRSLKDLLAILRRSIDHAMRRDKIGRNVAQLVTAPQGTAGRPSRAFTVEQARAVLAAMEKSRLYAYVVISLQTGIRTEEARALTWDHVQLTEKDGVPPHIMVWRSVRQHGDTKTKKSRRSLKLPPMSVEVLRRERRKQSGDRKVASERWNETNLVFVTRYGNALDPSSVRRDFRNAIKSVRDIHAYAWTPRELRHTFVSLMSAHGVSLEEIARLVGHSSTAVTELVYRKELRPVLTEGAEVMDEILGDEPAA